MKTDQRSFVCSICEYRFFNYSPRHKQQTHTLTNDWFDFRSMPICRSVATLLAYFCMATPFESHISFPFYIYLVFFFSFCSLLLIRPSTDHQIRRHQGSCESRLASFSFGFTTARCHSFRTIIYF